jgi:hypothetical protein
VRGEFLVPAAGQSFCEWKGVAGYLTVRVGDREAPKVAWFYADPTPAFEGHSRVRRVLRGPDGRVRVDDVVATPQPGGFYGGWVTPDVVGPFKGEPGTAGW